jgi:hypothetical protein
MPLWFFLQYTIPPSLYFFAASSSLSPKSQIVLIGNDVGWRKEMSPGAAYIGNDPANLPECDLLIAADGVNSTVRRVYEEAFQPKIEMGRAKFIWLGANKVLDAFNFIFHGTEHGLFQVHAYPFSGTRYG